MRGLFFSIIRIGLTDMATVRFLGKVNPDVIKVSVPDFSANWHIDEIGQDAILNVNISNSEVCVECKLDSYEEIHLVQLYRRAIDLARGSVHLVGFAMGCGLTVTLDTFIDPGQNRTTLVPQDQNLASLCTAFGLGASRVGDFSAVAQIVLSEPPLFMAFDDLIQSITHGHQSPNAAGRAIERIRNLMAPGIQDRNQAWGLMRQNLQIDRAYLDFITDLSKGPRHGDPQFIPGGPVTEAVKRAWVVMNRYLEYRKRGNVPLTAPEFPLLTS
jgi:uncharacterized protein YoaH (UPF0181 family)